VTDSNPNPRGRLDVLAARLAKGLVDRVEERSGRKVNAWENGLGELAEELIAESFPNTPVTLTSVARQFGILPAKKRLR
jgi:hypothetical protein